MDDFAEHVAAVEAELRHIASCMPGLATAQQARDLQVDTNERIAQLRREMAVGFVNVHCDLIDRFSKLHCDLIDRFSKLHCEMISRR